MEAMDAMKMELEGIKSVLQNSNAEKAAIDQVAMNNIKENVQLRAQTLLLQEKVRTLDIELNDLKAKMVVQTKELDDARAELEKLKAASVVADAA